MTGTGWRVAGFLVAIALAACGEPPASRPAGTPQPPAKPESAPPPVATGLHGRIANPDGSPLAGAVVRVEAVPPHQHVVDARPPVETVAGADGSYALPDLPDGDWRVQCSADGAWHVGAGVVRVPDVRRFDVVLPHGATFEGRLLDGDDGKPLAGVAVQALADDVVAESRTGADGRFSFDLRRSIVPVREFRIDVPGRCVHPEGWGMGCCIEYHTVDDHEKLDDFHARRGNTLRGVVTGPAGPVAGATVTMWTSIFGPGEGGGTDIVRTTTTDAAGAYEFAELESQNPVVRVDAKGLVQEGVVVDPRVPPNSWNDWAPPQCHVELPDLWPQPTEIGRHDVALVAATPRETGTVAGRVQDGRGEPVVGAVVRAGFKDEFVEARSGEDGAFTLVGVPAYEGASRLVATKDGFDEMRVDVTFPGDELRVVLPVETVVRGRVVDEKGSPIVGAAVSLWDVHDPELNPLESGPTSPQSSPSTSATTDAEGRYRVRAGKGTFQRSLVASAKGFTTEASSVLVEAKVEERGEEGDLVLASLHPLTGRVVRAGTDEPVAGATVAEVVAWSDEWDRILATTAADGSFRIQGIGAGKRKIVASAPGCVSTTAEIDASVVTAVRLELEPEVDFAGRIVFDDGAAPESPKDCEVNLYDHPRDAEGHWGSTAALEARTRDDGSFRFRALRPGRYWLSVQWGDPQVVTAQPGPFEIRANADLRVPVTRGATIEGVLLDERSRPAVDDTAFGATVTATPSDGEDRPKGRQDADRQTGAFRIGGLDHGLYDVAVKAKGFRRWSQDRVRPGGGMLVVKLDPGLAISGHVYDVDGRPVRGLTIVAIGEGMAGADSLEHPNDDPDDEGAFRISGLTPGTWRLRFFKDDGTSFDGKMRLPVASDFEAGTEGVELHCEAVEPEEK